jgi:hypothetical protein
MSGKKNKLIKRWAKATNRPYRLAKKTWKKMSAEEKEQVTRHMEFELQLIRDRVESKGGSDADQI